VGKASNDIGEVKRHERADECGPQDAHGLPRHRALALALGLALRAAGGYGFVAMSRTTRARAKALRPRLEVARLRAHGGLSQRVVVDGLSILAWCARVSATYAALIAEMAATAETGHRELVVVTPPDAPIALASPHRIVLSTTSAAALFRGNAFQNLSFSAPPSVLVADVAADRDLLDAIAAGAHNILDVATGRLWHGDVQEEYDLASAAERGRAAASLNPADTGALASAVVAPLASQTGRRLHVAAEIHRENGAVVLDGVAIDDGVRHHARGHKDALTGGIIPVMTSSMDVMDALYDVGFPLPKGVEDPALACRVLNPDEGKAPAGLGRIWQKVMSKRRDEDPVRISLDTVLDELPEVHEELRSALANEGLIHVYEDVCRTVPLFAAIECEGFHVDSNGLAADIASIVSEMNRAWQVVTSGPHAGAFRNLDLIRAPKEDVVALIQLSDGALPPSWRTNPSQLERFALAGNVRALAVRRLRALAAIHEWMKKLEVNTRLRSILEPSGTGRWYPHGDALFTIPKHEPEAGLLRRHLIPEVGHVFVSGDYAAFEPRLLAHQSSDPELIKACNAPDVYDHLKPLLRVPDRDTAKQALLAFMYGRSPALFAESLPLPLPDGHRIYAAIEAAFPVAMAYRERVHATETISARTMGGWSRVRGTELRHPLISRVPRERRTS